MDTTFISIHDLTENATILYSSDSVVDILGYTPDEIVNRSAWDFFSEDDLSDAQKFHQKRVASDKAAVLVYIRVQDKQGDWVGCECCFTIVYDVMVVCTSVYQRGLKSEKRAMEAPIVRRIFSSSPKDPRYHMLSHLSAKLSAPVKTQPHEARAALFLNRFTRTLTIMYATSGLAEVIGIPAETMRGRSFYYCISENCLQDAVKCLENAKGNDSIAYLRFWFRDPRVDDEEPVAFDDSDEDMTTDASEDGGVNLGADRSSHHTSGASGMDIDSDESKTDSRHSSGDSIRTADTHEAIFGESNRAESSTSSLPDAEGDATLPLQQDPIELEAVISCTSDGLVVCLRKARPLIPHPTQRPPQPVHRNGFFAAPWATEPVLPPVAVRAGSGYGVGSALALAPRVPQRDSARVSPVSADNGSDHNDFMSAIRDQAIFAWALTGINGSLADHSHGKPRGEAVPRDLPVWSSDSDSPHDNGNENGNSHAKLHKPDGPQDGRYGAQIFGDPGLGRKGDQRLSSRGSSSGNNSAQSTPFSAPPR